MNVKKFSLWVACIVSHYLSSAWRICELPVNGLPAPRFPSMGHGMSKTA